MDDAVDEIELEAIGNYNDDECFHVQTADKCDHSFSGIIFDITAKKNLPVAFLNVKSVAIRGSLGPITVWTTKGGSFKGKVCHKELWTCIYRSVHRPSYRSLTDFHLEEPLRFKAGETRGIYIHSAMLSDTGVVYDNAWWPRKERCNDPFISISIAVAHLSRVPFGALSSWGGSAYRARREFVGRVSYSVRWALWSPLSHFLYPSNFKKCAAQLLLIFFSEPSSESSERMKETFPLSVLLTLLNMLPQGWFDNDPKNGKSEKSAHASLLSSSSVCRLL